MFQKQIAGLVIVRFVELPPYLVDTEFFLSFHRIPP
jgi:hypothetical protein